MRDYIAEIPWATVRHVMDFNRGHRFEAVVDEKVVGLLRYAKDWPQQGVIIIHELVVIPEFKDRGVGVALLYKLHKNNPDFLINPNVPSEEGYEFIRQIWDTEPLVAKHAHLHPDVAKKLGVNDADPETS